MYPALKATLVAGTGTLTYLPSPWAQVSLDRAGSSPRPARPQPTAAALTAERRREEAADMLGRSGASWAASRPQEQDRGCTRRLPGPQLTPRAGDALPLRPHTPLRGPHRAEAAGRTAEGPRGGEERPL